MMSGVSLNCYCPRGYLSHRVPPGVTNTNGMSDMKYTHTKILHICMDCTLYVVYLVMILIILILIVIPLQAVPVEW